MVSPSMTVARPVVPAWAGRAARATSEKAMNPWLIRRVTVSIRRRRDRIQLEIRGSHDAWMLCFHRASDGTVVTIFPPQRIEPAQVLVNAPFPLPNPLYPLRLVASLSPSEEKYSSIIILRYVIKTIYLGKY